MDQENKNKKEIDLNEAPNDSDVKSNEWQSQTPSYLPGTPKIIQWVIKYSGGLVRNKKQAQYVIFGFVVLAIIISLFLIFSGGRIQKVDIQEIPIDQR